MGNEGMQRYAPVDGASNGIAQVDGAGTDFASSRPAAAIRWPEDSVQWLPAWAGKPPVVRDVPIGEAASVPAQQLGELLLTQRDAQGRAAAVPWGEPGPLAASELLRDIHLLAAPRG